MNGKFHPLVTSHYQNFVLVYMNTANSILIYTIEKMNLKLTFCVLS